MVGAQSNTLPLKYITLQCQVPVSLFSIRVCVAVALRFSSLLDWLIFELGHNVKLDPS